MNITRIFRSITAIGVCGIVLLASCSEDAIVPEVEEPVKTGSITLHLNCSMADATTDSIPTRSYVAPSAYYENVLHDIFALLFDADGICLAYSEYREIEGEKTVVENLTLQMSSYSENPNNTLYVFANLGEERYADLVGRYEKLYYSNFSKETFSIEAFKQLPTNQSNTTYLPACAIYKGAVTDDMTLSLIMGRYISSVKVKLTTSSSGTVFTNIKVGLQNAPKAQQYIPVAESADYLITDFFSDSEMEDKLTITKLTQNKDSTRYFYVGENISANEDQQVKIHLTGKKSNKDFETSIPLTSSGLVHRNSYYEVQLSLE